MSVPKPRRLPGWPDIRGWTALGFFTLAFSLLLMMHVNPRLLADASFMQFATLIISGGVILVGQNLFGGTKSGAETTAKIADAYAGISPMPNSPNPPPPAAPVTGADPEKS